MRRNVAGLHADLGVTGVPTELDLIRCVERFPKVRLRHADVETAFCVHLPGGGALIIVPRFLRGREWEQTVSHELGHANYTCGLSPVLRQMASGNPRLLRLARLWQWKEERIAAAFATAWLVGSDGVMG